MKVCPRCKIEKTLDCFSPDKKATHGVTSRCKSCNAEVKREEYRKNPEKYRELSKQQSRKKYETRRSEVLEAMRNYRKENAEKVRQWKRNDRERNKIRIANDNARRRALIRDKNIENTKEVYALRDFYIAMSLGEPFHVDHIVPLSKGGTHSLSNLQVIPAIDNLRKGNYYHENEQKARESWKGYARV